MKRILTILAVFAGGLIVADDAKAQGFFSYSTRIGNNGALTIGSGSPGYYGGYGYAAPAYGYGYAAPAYEYGYAAPVYGYGYPAPSYGYATYASPYYGNPYGGYGGYRGGRGGRWR